MPYKKMNTKNAAIQSEHTVILLVADQKSKQNINVFPAPGSRFVLFAAYAEIARPEQVGLKSISRTTCCWVPYGTVRFQDVAELDLARPLRRVI